MSLRKNLRRLSSIRIQKSEKPAQNFSYPLQYITLGPHIWEAWFGLKSAYPEELINENTLTDGILYVCDRCFKYTGNAAHFASHLKHCNKGIPGRVVFDSGKYSFYEVDGEEFRTFCQCLALFARPFLDVKTVSYDTDGFLFYLLVENSPETGRPQILGFFSKEKLSWDDNNLACILIFPPHQRRGLGKLLISFSYEISKSNKRIGQPEKPLSELGRKGYISYWKDAINACLDQRKAYSHITVGEMSMETCIAPDDLISALREMNIVRKTSDKDTKYKIVRRRSTKSRKVRILNLYNRIQGFPHFYLLSEAYFYLMVAHAMLFF